jgi:hypothetical protein
MTAVKRGLVVLLTTAGLAAGSAAQAQNDFVIAVGGPRQQHRIGSYYVNSPQNAGRSYAAAVRAFGRPTSLRPNAYQTNRCTGSWPSLGLTITFETEAPQPCSATKLALSFWAGATIRARLWRTDRGLRVGDSLAKLRRLYPDAQVRKTTAVETRWVLVSVPGEVAPVIYLEARVLHGRVIVLDVPPGNVNVAR